MSVLRHAHRLCRTDGIILDLTSLPPAASIEHGGAELGQLDQKEFLERARVTEAAVDRLVADGLLQEEARLDHDVLKYFDSGAELLADAAARPFANVPSALAVRLTTISTPVVERSSCLLRRLRVTRPV